MTTIVASPPTLTTLPRLTGWDGDHTGFTLSMSNDDVSRFMPQRKAVTRSSSSSSLASTASNSSTSTVTSAADSTSSTSSNGEPVAPLKKKTQRGGFWPVSKAESTSSVTNTRANGAVQPAATNGVSAMSQKSPATPVMSEQSAQQQMNGAAARAQSPALLVLLPINGTFERKQISVPVQPDPPLKIGRQTNNKTTPKQDNGYFDSKVLSRQHAEISADAQGRVFIRDVKSSNGTFVNGERLSPENRESELRELRAEDSLELGIDIVSEDQKTIVHHKVSAKVEFAGFPGKAGNAMDNILNFGDLQGSQGGALLGGTPMAHQRSQQGRPINGRGSVSSSAASGAMSNVSYRQANYYGAALNIEQLVKQVATEMRAAKQQAQDLDQTKTYLNSLAPADGSPSKLNPPQLKEPRANTRQKTPRIEHAGAARFLQPPAPPPQQPLPEKPDSAKSGLKRETTAKPLLNGMTTSPTGGQQSQILALINDLKEAQKQIESQSSRVKELEDALKRERLARESAEAQVRKMADINTAKPVVEQPELPTKELAEVAPPPVDPEADNMTDAVHSELQQRLDFALQEMQSMKQSLEETSKRADAAEADRSSLASMIEKYRLEKERAEAEAVHDDPAEEVPQSPDSSNTTHSPKHSRQANGHPAGPQIPDGLHHAVSTMLQHQKMGDNGEVPPQYAPYVSMMGVVLIGFGIMTYLNSWQKVDK